MKTIELKVSGMTCGSCVSHVSKALQGVSGVHHAGVDLASQTATVTGDDLDAAVLIAAVEEEGYSATETQQPSNAIPLTGTSCSCCG